MSIRLVHNPKSFTSPSIVTIGNFDGVHLGHQALLNTAIALANENQCKSVLLTFEPYPQHYFQPDQPLAKLTSIREKLSLLNSYNLDYLCCLRFNKKLAELFAKQFIEEVLLKQLNAKIIVVGEDFRFGYQRQGDVALLKSYKQLRVVTCPAIKLNDERISSTRIRKLLWQGDFAEVAKLLGHDYFMLGKVVHGNQRGRLLGFPTANIALRNRALPLHGVYVVKVLIDDKTFFGVANIGRRPTIDGKTVLLEVYLLDFSGDLYGKHLRVEFLHKIRDEMKFASVDVLKLQIAEDVRLTHQFLQI